MAFSISSHAAIYGADSRKDISQVSSKWQKAAQAVAVSVPSFYFLDLDTNHYYHEEHEDRAYGESMNMCTDEKFVDQKSFGHCSAFLVHPKIIVTAGHCILPKGTLEGDDRGYCENFSFWFQYNDTTQPISALGSIIPKRDVVQCENLIYASNNDEGDPDKSPIDFAIFELNEPVTHIEPLKISLKELVKGEPVATIGHPHGLPAKHSGLSPLLKNYDTTLSAFLDTLGGNSGGPAFNSAGEVVGILISGHQTDTYADNGCERINTCNLMGLNCDEDTELENSNLLMKPQVWQPYIDKFLENTNPLS